MMASTAYLLEVEEFVKGKKVHERKLGAFTTMDKAVVAAEAHVNWKFNEVGENVNWEYTQPFQTASFYSLLVWKNKPVEQPNPSHPDYIYSVTKIRIR